MGETNGRPANRDEILAALSRRRHKNVVLPVSEITVRVQSLNEKEWASYLAAMNPAYGPDGAAIVGPIDSMNAERKLVGLGVVDDKDERVFREAEDAGKLPPRDIDVLAEAIKEITVVSSQQSEALVKNSSTTSDEE